MLGLIYIWDALPVACLACLPVLTLEPASAAARILFNYAMHPAHSA